MSLKQELQLSDLPQEILRMVYRYYWIIKGYKPCLEEIREEHNAWKSQAWCVLCGEAPDKCYDDTYKRGRVVCLSRKLRLMDGECFQCLTNSAQGYEPPVWLIKMYFQDKCNI